MTLYSTNPDSHPHHSPHEALIQLLSAIWPFIMRLVPIQASHPECLLLIWLTSFWYQPHCTCIQNTSRGPSTTDLLSSHQVPHINISSHLMSELKSSIQSLCLIPVSEPPFHLTGSSVLTHVSHCRHSVYLLPNPNVVRHVWELEDPVRWKGAQTQGSDTRTGLMI